MSITSPPPINLLRGWPAPSLLPNAAMQSAALRVLADPSKAQPALLYGPDQGYAPLRDALAAWLANFYGAPELPERICVTGGASQNLAVILQVFADPGTTRNVWMVAPCYHLACRVFTDAGFADRLRAVPEDEEGIDIGYLERRLKEADAAPWKAVALKPPRPWAKHYRHLVYAVPTFANPSGKIMSLARRKQLVALARRHDALLITDDVYDFLQWPSDPSSTEAPRKKALLPRLVDIDRILPHDQDVPEGTDDGFGHAVSNGSFSKIVGPGLRTGWAEGTPRLAYGLSQAGSTRSGGAPSQLAAAIVAEYLASGELSRAVAGTLVPAYAARYRTLTRAVERFLVPLGVQMATASHEGVFGGYFIWLDLPKGLHAETVAKEALSTKQLTLAPGPMFAVYGDEAAVDLSRGVRLCFAWEDEEKMEDGMERLAKVIDGL